MIRGVKCNLGYALAIGKMNRCPKVLIFPKYMVRKAKSIKLKAIVRDEGTRDPKPCDNVFPDKLLGVYVSDIHQGFSFNPLSEVVRAD